ncbi:MAG: hypothetical protein J6Y86_07450 [Pseudobutyrivibrio sp.]|nr:hypothetical protein [Pseudobutyrivibrio sp.]
MGKIYARLIHKQVYEGIETGYYSLSDVPAKYQSATRTAWDSLFSYPLPETAA